MRAFEQRVWVCVHVWRCTQTSAQSFRHTTCTCMEVMHASLLLHNHYVHLVNKYNKGGGVNEYMNRDDVNTQRWHRKSSFFPP